MMKLFNRKHSHGHGGHGGGNDPSHIEAGHLTDHGEYRDLNFRSVVQFLIALFGTVAFSYISMFGMMKVFQWNHEDSQLPLSPVADTAFRAVGPRIQVAPNVDLTNFRWSEDSILTGEKKEPGVISIDQAIKDVAAEGLPYRQTATPNASADTGAIAPNGAATGASVTSPDSGAANAGAKANGSGQ